jgi:quercetin dioxygenase-like cupin family protein
MNAEPRWFLRDLCFIHTRGAENEGRFGMLELWGPPGDQPPPHVHHSHDEGFYVLAGEVTVFLPDAEVVLTEGEFFNAPRGVPHTYRVTSPATTRWLVTSSPAGAEGFIEEYSKPAGERRLPDDEPPDIERLIATAGKYDIEILGPPGVLPKDLVATSDAGEG